MAQDFSKDTLWTKNLWPEEVRACRFTPDGKYVIAAVGKTICKFDALTGELVSRFKDTCDETITVMEISKNFSIIATLDFPQDTLFIWDVIQEKIIKKIPVKNNTSNGASHMVISSDDRYLILGLLRSDVDNLIIYNTDTWKEEKILSLLGGWKRIAISPDDKYFVVGSLDYNESEERFYSHLTLWKTENWEFVNELGYFKGEIIGLNYSYDGKYLLFGRNSGDPEPIYVWDMETLYKFKEYPKSKTGQTHYKAKLSPDYRYIALSSGPPPIQLATLIWDFINDTLICKYNYPSDDLDVNQIGDNIILTNILKLISIKPKLIPSSKIDYSKENPFLKLKYINNLLNISLSSALPAFYKLEIYDNSGKMITEVNLGYLEKGDHIFTRTIQLSSGVYFATIRFGGSSISKQFDVVR